MSATALAWRQFRLERKLFWRNPSAAFFGFVLPLALLLLLASTVATDSEGREILVPGIAALSVMATTFNSMAYSLTFLREQGILKRMRGTPIPAPSYFAGFLGNAVANAFVQVGLIVVFGKLLYGVGWPADWLELALFTTVGVAAFGSLGIALSHAIPNFDAAPAYVNAIFLPVILISGVFYSSDSLPGALEAIAQALPLMHVVDGFSDAIVAGEGLGSELGSLAAVAAWGAAGLALAIRGFRWDDE